MMDESAFTPDFANAPIGVFDSGVGGLSVLNELVKQFPNENFVYIGDTANMPYGEKEAEHIQSLALNMVDTLVNQFQVKAIVVACNTSAGVLGDYWHTQCPVPAIEPVTPTISAIANQKQYKKLALLATPTTVASGRYQTLLKQLAPGIELSAIGCTGLAAAVENQTLTSASIEQDLCKWLTECDAFGAEAIIHGCTHYPFAEGMMKQLQAQQHLKPTPFLNPAHYMANTLQNSIKPNTSQKQGQIQLIATSNPDAFLKTAQALALDNLTLDRVSLLEADQTVETLI